MNSFKLILFSLLLILLSTTSFAASKVKDTKDAVVYSGGEVKIGYVDFNRALNSVADGKRAKQRLKDEFREKQQQLDRLQSELKSMRENLDKDRLLLSPDVLDEKEAAYRDKFNRLQQNLQSFKIEMNTKEATMTQDVLNRLRSIVKDIGKEGAYTLILEKSQDVVLYAPDGNDLTDRVIAICDRGRGK